MMAEWQYPIDRLVRPSIFSDAIWYVEGTNSIEEFNKLRRYLQAYADIADPNIATTDSKVDELWEQSKKLSYSAMDKIEDRTILHRREDTLYGKRQADPALTAEGRQALMDMREKNKEFLEEAEYCYRKAAVSNRDLFSAVTRLDKVTAIEELIHLQHLSGNLLPELFGFPAGTKYVNDYCNAVMDRLAEKRR